MSYKTDIADNNAELSAILSAIKALPEGGGGTSLCVAYVTAEVYEGVADAFSVVFEEGMTWEDYVASGYNKRATSASTFGKQLEVFGGNVVSGKDEYIFISNNEDGNFVLPSAEILNGAVYYQIYSYD